MKPHEETWETDWVSDYVVTLKIENSNRSIGQFSAGGPEGVQRARLAAAAPEMARVLLKMQWASGAGFGPSGDDQEYRDCACYFCDGRPEDLKLRSGTVIGKGHEDNCPLVAVLRKAGVDVAVRQSGTDTSALPARIEQDKRAKGDK